MKKITLILMAITVFVKILGFSRDIVLSYFFGTSGISDAYLISITIPTVIFAFIGIGITTSYIPIFSKVKKESGTMLSDNFTNNIINSILVISTFIVIFVLVFTPPIVKLFASGFDGEMLALTIKFTRITIFSIYFSGLVYVLTGYLNVNKKFIIPALMAIPLNIFLILSITLGAKYNISFLSFGLLVAMASQVLFLLVFAYKSGYRYNLVFNIKDKYLKRMTYLAIPAILGISVNEINILIDRTLASQIALGGISALNYASRLNLFIQAIFVMSISTVMYPLISKMAADKNMQGLKKSVSEAISGVSLLVIPATVCTMIFAEPVVKLLYGRGEFDSSASFMTSNALFFYSIGMIGFGFREILSRAFYSLQDTKTPVINATIGMGLNIILNIILSKYLGLGGLALATSIAAIFTTILLFISLRKKIGNFGINKISISFLKILFASLVMGFIAKFLFNLLSNNLNQNLSLIISVVLGAISYLSIIYYMKVDNIDIVMNAIKKKLRKS